MNSLTLRALVAELDALRGRRLDRVHTADNRTFLLDLEGGMRLVLSTDPAHDTLYPRPAPPGKPVGESPTSRSLQRVLAGSRFDGALQAGLDRVVALRFLGRDRLGDGRAFTLVVELLGPGANLILTEGKEAWEGRILDRLRPDRSRSRPRLLKSGVPYRLPAHDRADLLRDGEAAVREVLAGLERPLTAAAIAGACAGMTPAVAGLVLEAAGGDPSPGKIAGSWAGILEEILPPRGDAPAGARYRPCLALGEGAPEAWPCLPPADPADAVSPEEPGAGEEIATGEAEIEMETHATVGEALAAAHRAHREGRRRDARGGVEAALERARRKAARALEAIARELAQEDKAGQLRRQGEAVLAAAHEIPKGASRVELLDPESGEPMTVRLNPALSPSENAELYFKKARKADRSGTSTGGRAREFEERLATLDALAEELAQGAPDPDWLERARVAGVDLPDAEAARSGKPRAPEDRLPGDLRPRRYDLGHGWEALVGRSNRGNDILTHEIARPHDLWMHAESVPGSHLVLRHSEKGKEPPQSVLLAAAAIAAWFSKSRHSGKVPVTITEKRHVRRPRKAPPGLAMVGEHRTLIVPPRNPDEKT